MQTTSTTSNHTLLVDTHLAKFGQACTVVLTGLGFLLNQPVIVAVTAAILWIAAIVPPVSPWRLIYKWVLLPLHVLRPRVVEDDPAPHRFAQGVGAIFLTASSLVLFLTHATVPGWTLDLIVFALAAINLFIGFCAGCFVYYHLGRLGLLPRVRYAGEFHWRGV